jgi:caffeoyl-CoA O-methyltransferase
MNITDPSIEAYAEAHTTPVPAALEALAAETREKLGGLAGMMVGALEGRFLEMLVFALRPKIVLEIGTFTGYSSIAMAGALPPGGRIITCDINEKSQAAARRHAEAAGVADRIDYRLGPAIDTIKSLDLIFDFVFVDADKSNYLNYYEAVLPNLSAAGMIAADNTLWSGAVLNDDDQSEDTFGIKAFNDFVVRDSRVICVQLPIRDGVTLIRKA